MSKIEDIINYLKNNTVTIGIHGEKGEQKKLVRTHAHGSKVKGKKEKISENLTVAQVATYNEFGTKHIPSRPFLRRVFQEKRRNIFVIASLTLKNKPMKLYDVLGQYVLNEIQKSIKNKSFTPNSPFTVARKGSSTPLVDTGQLRNALTYKVNEI